MLDIRLKLGITRFEYTLRHHNSLQAGAISIYRHLLAYALHLQARILVHLFHAIGMLYWQCLPGGNDRTLSTITPRGMPAEQSSCAEGTIDTGADDSHPYRYFPLTGGNSRTIHSVRSSKVGRSAGHGHRDFSGI